jgi:CMP-2-keto-3-deoxyoctulosonic acid synthetase
MNANHCRQQLPAWRFHLRRLCQQGAMAEERGTEAACTFASEGSLSSRVHTATALSQVSCMQTWVNIPLTTMTAMAQTVRAMRNQMDKTEPMVPGAVPSLSRSMIAHQQEIVGVVAGANHVALHTHQSRTNLPSTRSHLKLPLTQGLHQASSIYHPLARRLLHDSTILESTTTHRRL